MGRFLPPSNDYPTHIANIALHNNFHFIIEPLKWVTEAMKTPLSPITNTPKKELL
jgi:hypothetical protein